MKIKKVDDKIMVIHTKKKTKIHAHEAKKASIYQPWSRYSQKTLKCETSVTNSRICTS